MVSRWWFLPTVIAVSLALVAVGVVALMLVLLYPNLPTLEALNDYRPKQPLRVYSAEDELLAEFGEERRALVSIAEVPAALKNALIAAEDERFYSHGGVDYIASARAVLAVATGGKRQGGGTLTMQLARDMFLSREFTPARKISEALLAVKIERNFSKDQILELYMNQIFLGQRAYGFAAAADVYFGKTLQELSVAEAAMLVGLAPAPSRYNPLSGGQKWAPRQRYVLGRMLERGYITKEQHQAASAEKLAFGNVRTKAANHNAESDYVTEMVRQAAVEKYGAAAMVSGLRVYTTIRKKDQLAATAALRKGVIDYDRRHGYRGPEGFVANINSASTEEALDDALQDKEPIADFIPAVVLAVEKKETIAYTKRGERVSLNAESLKFASRYMNDPSKSDRVRAGSLIRVMQDEKGVWSVSQVPKIEAALVSIDPKDGAIYAVAGGFDFNANKFNHVTQALRQPGSSFKPFIYSAALEKGFTAASIINDAPIVIDASTTGSGETWEPKNYDGRYDGPMRMRTALAKSKNMVSIRLLQSMGTKYAQDYITRFGFSEKDHPAYLTMALGAGSTTPLQMAAGYAVFANGGYRVKPYFIRRVTDNKGVVLQETTPEIAGVTAERVIDSRNAFIMSSMMRDVVSYGTATRALKLGRKDLGGKTGTTNDHYDAWFAGFNPNLVGIAWIGFDQPSDMGNDETGGKAALPIWMDYMATALKPYAQKEPQAPPGLIAMSVDGKNEWIYTEMQGRIQNLIEGENQKANEEVKSQIF